MSKKVLTLILVLTLANAAYPAKIKSHFKVWTGLNQGKYSAAPTPIGIPEVSYKTGWRTGFGLGVGVELPMSESPFSLIFGLGYMEKGSTVDSYYLNNRVQSWPYKLGNLNQTGLIKVGFGKKVALYALAGYELGLVLKHRGKAFGPSAPSDETDLKPDTKNLEVSLVAGVGLEFKLEKINPFVELSYSHGLVNLSRATRLLEDYPLFKSRMLLLSAGLRFWPSKK